MTRSRVGILTLCAVVLGLMSFVTGIAQAEPGSIWLILDKDGTLLTTATLPATAQITLEAEDGALLTKILGIKVRILCTAAEAIGASLEKEGKITNGSKVKFTGCKTFLTPSGKAEEESKACSPHTKGAPAGTIETNKLLGLIVLHKLEPSGTKDELVLIHPSEGTAFVTFEMEATCPIGEKIPVNGDLLLQDCEKAFLKHQVIHLWVQGPLTELWVLNKNAEHLETSLDGSVLAFLIGPHLNLSWGGDPG